MLSRLGWRLLVKWVFRPAMPPRVQWLYSPPETARPFDVDSAQVAVIDHRVIDALDDRTSFALRVILSAVPTPGEPTDQLRITVEGAKRLRDALDAALETIVPRPDRG